MTSQQTADELLREHQANRGRNMDLQDWDVKVKPHLHFIEAGAEMAARHARLLLIRPDFTTHAQDELVQARQVLESALTTIKTAQEAYEAKPLESSRAA
jgi:hypothetical protein